MISRTLLALALSVPVLAVPARAGETCAVRTQPPTSTNWTRTFEFAKHDPARGPLDSVVVRVTSWLSGDVRVENPSFAARYDTRFACSTTVRRPDASLLVGCEPSIESALMLGTFDGTLDFAGDSGVSFTDLTAVRSDFVVLRSAADLALFTANSPGETIPLSASAQGISTASGPGAVVIVFTTLATAAVEVCYAVREANVTAALSSQTTNWTRSLTIAKHDPATGPLRAIRLRTRGNLDAIYGVENAGPTPVRVDGLAAVAIDLYRPDATSISALSAFSPFVDHLAAYDGTIDFAGTSGVVHSSIVARGDAAIRLDSAADRALFTASFPGETITLGVQARDASQASAPGAVVVLFATNAGFELEVGYDRASLVSPHCAGDGSSAPCPCGNASAPGSSEGCVNTTGLGGALRASGLAQLGSDTLVLTASNLPATTAALLIQGTSALAVPFGDGLRCVGGSVLRLGSRTASGGSVSYPPSGATISGLGGATTGSTLHYQVWYRNAAPFCTSSTFNLTNALSVAW